ncbi:MAG: glycosyltransferase family 39 protein [Patescibacteria group bacterium]
MKSKIFWAVLVLAFTLRFYKLGEVPLSLDWDENSNAYNAYSILKTGRDQYGDFLPITNRSFDDYKPPAYMYLNVPTVAIFGLTPFAARLPSAIFGFLTVPLIYFLTQKVLEYWPKFSEKRETISLVAMLLLAISPWHLQFSRVGFEATVGLFTAVAAAAAFLYGIKDHKWLIVAAIATGLSSYTYHTQRIFVPLLAIVTFIIWKKDIFKISKKFLATFIIVTILISLPLAILIPPKVILQRFEVTTGRPKLEDIEKSIKFILQDQAANIPFANITHNRRFVIGQTYFANYLSHFSPNFLFTKGDDNFRHHIQDMGMLYLFELPLFLYGIYLAIRFKSKASAFLLCWLLFAPIAATPATPNPHGNRSLPLLIAVEIISAVALVSLFSINFRFKNILRFIYLFWITTAVLVYLHNYWQHYPVEKASFWQYGYREAVLESEKVKDRYEKILVDQTIEQAYIFWLFNLKYDPREYLESGSLEHFDKYYFRALPPQMSNELYISDAGHFPGNFEIIKTIYYPDGSEIVRIGHPR